MFQPNKELRAILVACVKPESLQAVIENIIERITVYNENEIYISGLDTITGGVISLKLDASNFDEVLEFGKWYPREKFDGNPCNYILVTLDGRGTPNAPQVLTDTLGSWVTHFMYIKKP